MVGGLSVEPKSIKKNRWGYASDFYPSENRFYRKKQDVVCELWIFIHVVELVIVFF